MRPSKYEPIARWLREIEEDEDAVAASFGDLEALIGSLPASAREHASWWGNSGGRPHADAWMSAGWRAVQVAVAGESVTFVRGEAVQRGQGRAPLMNGTETLERMLEHSSYGSVEAAVAAHTLFLHPDTVTQTAGRAILPVVRDDRRRRDFGSLEDGREVGFDDNATPTDVFLWAADRIRGADTQFNHVWKCARDPDAYTALWNLCCTPAFIAKTTDNHPLVVPLLRYRSWDLFGFVPAGMEAPPKPPGYADLAWLEPPAANQDLESLMRQRMRAAPERFATRVARRLGWVFSDGPDATAGGLPGRAPV